MGRHIWRRKENKGGEIRNAPYDPISHAQELRSQTLLLQDHTDMKRNMPPSPKPFGIISHGPAGNRPPSAAAHQGDRNNHQNKRQGKRYGGELELAKWHARLKTWERNFAQCDRASKILQNLTRHQSGKWTHMETRRKNRNKLPILQKKIPNRYTTPPHRRKKR